MFIHVPTRIALHHHEKNVQEKSGRVGLLVAMFTYSPAQPLLPGMHMPPPDNPQFVLHLSPHEGEPLMVGPFSSADAVHEWIDDHDKGEWDHGTAYVLEAPGDETGESLGEFVDGLVQRAKHPDAEPSPVVSGGWWCGASPEPEYSTLHLVSRFSCEQMDCPGPHRLLHLGPVLDEESDDGDLRPPEIDRTELMHALWDGVADRFDPGMDAPDEHWDWYVETIEHPVAQLLCHVYGHEPVQDHCGRPEHDHCAWCMTLMPGAAER